MNYDFAKYLKDAGYPQSIKRGFLLLDENGQNPVYIPELEEIIEECGDSFASLKRISDENSLVFWRTESNEEKYFNGKSAKESVGWLFLDKKHGSA